MIDNETTGNKCAGNERFETLITGRVSLERRISVQGINVKKL
jgi:hypothetical protein